MSRTRYRHRTRWRTVWSCSRLQINSHQGSKWWLLCKVGRLSKQPPTAKTCAPEDYSSALLFSRDTVGEWHELWRTGSTAKRPELVHVWISYDGLIIHHLTMCVCKCVRVRVCLSLCSGEFICLLLCVGRSKECGGSKVSSVVPG